MERKHLGIGIGLLGLALAAAGLIVGLLQVQRDGVKCGSGFSGLSNRATQADIDNTYSVVINGEKDYPTSGTVVGDCNDALGSNKTTGLALVIPGAILVLSGFVLWSMDPGPSAPVAQVSQPDGSEHTAASASDELARLAELHRSGALTDEEFTAAKAKVLGS